MGHTFIHCSTSKSFFNQVLLWFNDVHVTSFSLSSDEFLFGTSDKKQSPHSDNAQKKLNYCLLFAKYYFYCQKIKKKDIQWEEFKQRITYKLEIEGLR